MKRFRRQSNVIVMNIPWEALDAAAARDFLSRANALTLEDARIVLDFSRVETIDTAGIRALLTLLKHVNAEGGELKLCNLNRRVQSFLVMVRLQRVFEVYATKAEAIRSFGERDTKR
ncbi:MAG: STAS domain-containing protein [Acidobacteria bacterium]|nr:STAS domain-containing protein [Acidobacteriota bacterium]